MGVLNRYTVEWYNPLTGQLVDTTQTRSGLLGALELEYPHLTADDSRPLVLFKLYRTVDGSFLRPEELTNTILNSLHNDDNILSETTKSETSSNQPINLDITITPNPATDNVTVEIPFYKQEPIYWELYNVQGTLVSKGEAVSKKFTFNISTYPTGVYIFKLYDGDNVHNKKLLKK